MSLSNNQSMANQSMLEWIKIISKSLTRNVYSVLRAKRSATIFGSFFSADLISEAAKIESDNFAKCQVSRRPFEIETALSVRSNPSLDFFQIFRVYGKGSAGAHRVSSLIDSAVECAIRVIG